MYCNISAIMLTLLATIFISIRNYSTSTILHSAGGIILIILAII